MNSRNDLPILIIGAGPVGLSLAIALTNQGIRVQVFEMLPVLSPEARAITFHPATLEMFEEWEVIEQVLAKGYRADTLQYWERENRELIAEFDYHVIAEDTPYPFRLHLPQSYLTRLLKPLVEASGYGDVFLSHRLTRFADHGTHVEAIFETSAGEKTVQGSYLCGADGAESAVRTQLGIGFEGLTYIDRFLMVTSNIALETVFPGIGPAAYLFDPDEGVIYQDFPGMRRLVFRITDETTDDEIRQEGAVRERVARVAGEDIAYNIIRISVYSAHQRTADTFRLGRVLLLGDAAHVNNPVGGMGMNSGIHDAFSLSLVLPSVLDGASDELLDQYSAERHITATQEVQHSSDRIYHDMIVQGRSARVARNTELQMFAADPQQARVHLLRASMLSYRI